MATCILICCLLYAAGLFHLFLRVVGEDDEQLG